MFIYDISLKFIVKILTPTLIWDPTVIDFEWKFTPLHLFHTLQQFERLEYYVIKRVGGVGQMIML